ncbi:TraM recognition domain-containing protein [Thalassospira xianhensis]|uniref:TraM recognition domain-containing protein n=1 Tax=Thalassospira xianhensis TaxID=478503 RepID=UPI000DEDE660|nr:TraM recognition domain-containing protein [Thalassospira xianhensis]
MAVKPIFNGATDEQIRSPNLDVRDVRPVPTKVVDWLRKPQNMVVTLFGMAGASVLYGMLSDWLLIVAVLLFSWALSVTEKTPIKIPMQEKMPDPNEAHPKTGKPTIGKGIFFIGNDQVSGKEIWLTNDDCRQHFLILGTTGAGKTEALLSFAANALSWGSGLLFCDGKGDVSLFAKVYVMARRFGREDDLLVLNFMNGNRQNIGSSVRSNTMNPVATGSADGITQMIVSLMDDVGGDGAMWKGRATAMLTGVIRALCWLRDDGLLDLNVGAIRSHMSLRAIVELGNEECYPDMPAPIRVSIQSYLSSLPGYNAEKKENQAQTTLDQHGYLEMQFTKILGNLADVYGHIFATPFGEVDMYDVVLNRRILVIMLPALEVSGDEIANLGKIVVATLKGMMGATLGSKLDGSWADVVLNRQTNSPSPFMVILDEVGYYTVEGMALMAAQARSLGFSMVYASQDIPAMKRLNEKEAASIIANTNTKIFMRTEEVNETGRLAVETGDKVTRVRTSGFERADDGRSLNYASASGAQFEEVNRVNFTDLKKQGPGLMHVMFQEKVVRARGFYANPESALELDKVQLRANHFIRVTKPTFADMESARRVPEVLNRFLNEPDFIQLLIDKETEALNSVVSRAEEGDEIALIARNFEVVLDGKRKPIEAACAAVSDIWRKISGATSAFAERVHTSMTMPASGGFAEPRNIMPGGMPDDLGIPFGDAEPPIAPPRREFSGPSRDKRIDARVKHGASVDDGSIIDMTKQIQTNDPIMRSLAAIDFDEEGADPIDVDEAIEEALGSDSFMEPKGKPMEHGRIERAVDDFDRSSSTISNLSDDDDDDDGEDDGDVEDILVTAFLEQLQKGDDD